MCTMVRILLHSVAVRRALQELAAAWRTELQALWSTHSQQACSISPGSQELLQILDVQGSKACQCAYVHPLAPQQT